MMAHRNYHLKLLRVEPYSYNEHTQVFTTSILVSELFYKRLMIALYTPLTPLCQISTRMLSGGCLSHTWIIQTETHSGGNGSETHVFRALPAEDAFRPRCWFLGDEWCAAEIGEGEAGL